MISERNYPGLLYAQVLRSPYPRARIMRLDISKAAPLPGVKAILTYQDPEVARLKPTNAGWTDAVDTVSYDNMMWRKFRDRRVLGDYAAWAGDEVGVAVAAESELIAEQALRLVEVEWEVLPFVLDPLAAMQPGAPVIHPADRRTQRAAARSDRRPRRLSGQGRRGGRALPRPMSSSRWTPAITTRRRARWIPGVAWRSGRMTG